VSDVTASAVRPDGHPLRLLCESLQSRLDELSVELTDDIRREIPSYAAFPLAEQRRTVRVRLGLVRAGLAGAETSISDAERALVVAEQGGRATPFEDAWLRASLVDSRDRLLPLFTEVRRVAGEQPQLAETVLAFADCGLSLAHTADALHIHANTVAYRLGQWHKLTGTDPRTFEGLVRSVVGITS